MNPPFKVDGVQYNVFVPSGGIKRSGQVLDGGNAGRTKTGAMIRDIIGTFYNYTIAIETQQAGAAEYDKLYEVLTSPTNQHTIEVPYAQSTLVFNAYVTSAEDTLEMIVDGTNRWTGLSVTFIAMKPQRRP